MEEGTEKIPHDMVGIRLDQGVLQTAPSRRPGDGRTPSWSINPLRESPESFRRFGYEPRSRSISASNSRTFASNSALVGFRTPAGR